MPETDPSSQSSIFESLRSVIHNGIDYLMSSFTLLQAKMTDMALSAVVFITVLFLCLLMALTSFVLLTVAAGLWLAKILGSGVLSLIVLGLLYAVLAAATARWASGWINKQSSHD